MNFFQIQYARWIKLTNMLLFLVELERVAPICKIKKSWWLRRGKQLSKQSREEMIVWNFYTYRRQKCRGRTIWNPRVEEQQGAEDREGTRISKCYHPWSHAGTICSSQPASSETFRLETSRSLTTRPLRTFKETINNQFKKKKIKSN